MQQDWVQCVFVPFNHSHHILYVYDVISIMHLLNFPARGMVSDPRNESISFSKRRKNQISILMHTFLPLPPLVNSYHIHRTSLSLFSPFLTREQRISRPANRFRFSLIKLSQLIDPIQEVSDPGIDVREARFCTSGSKGRDACQVPTITDLALKRTSWVSMTCSFTSDLSSSTQMPLTDTDLEFGKVCPMAFTVVVHLDLYLL